MRRDNQRIPFNVIILWSLTSKKGQMKKNCTNWLEELHLLSNIGYICLDNEWLGVILGCGEQTLEQRNRCERQMNKHSAWGPCTEKGTLRTYLERIMAPRFTLTQDFRFFIPTCSMSIFAKQPSFSFSFIFLSFSIKNFRTRCPAGCSAMWTSPSLSPQCSSAAA